MALKPGDRTNFNTMLRAHSENALALVESRDKDGRYVALVCAMQENEDGTISPIPFAEMIRGNPFELYADPTQKRLPRAKKE